MSIAQGFPAYTSPHPLPLRVKEAVQQLQADARVVLFGSRARGDYRPESDWDFLILLPASTAPHIGNVIRDHLYEVELQSHAVISSVIETEENWKKLEVTPFFQNIQEEGLEIILPPTSENELS